MSIKRSWALYHRQQAANQRLANGLAAQLRKEVSARTHCLSCLRGRVLNSDSLCSTCADINRTTDGCLLALVSPAVVIVDPNPPLQTIKEAEPQGEPTK